MNGDFYQDPVFYISFAAILAVLLFGLFFKKHLVFFHIGGTVLAVGATTYLLIVHGNYLVASLPIILEVACFLLLTFERKKA